MPTGPRGQKRPADVVGDVVHIMQIATGEIQDTQIGKSGRTNSGFAGAGSCVKSTSPQQRTEIANKAAFARWR